MKRIIHASLVASAVVAALALAGCSAKSDFEKICNAPELSGAAGEKSPADKAVKIAEYIKANAHSTQAKEWFSNAANSTGDKGALLKQAAHDAGYDGPCPMADMH